MTTADRMQAVREAWGGEPPDWVIVLAEAVFSTSQGAAARRLGYSKSVISEILKNQYKGSLARIEQAVRGGLMGAKVACPVLGQDITTAQCLTHQRRPFSSIHSNVLHMRLWRGCKTCPNRMEAANAEH